MNDCFLCFVVVTQHGVDFISSLLLSCMVSFLSTVTLQLSATSYLSNLGILTRYWDCVQESWTLKTKLLAGVFILMVTVYLSRDCFCWFLGFSNIFWTGDGALPGVFSQSQCVWITVAQFFRSPNLIIYTAFLTLSRLDARYKLNICWMPERNPLCGIFWSWTEMAGYLKFHPWVPG